MTRQSVPRPDRIRGHNLSLILDQVHRVGPVTRAELTARLRLSRSTVGSLVSELTELGLVAEMVPTGGDRAGRPSHVVGPHANGPFVVAVDVDLDQVTIAAVGIGGTVLAREVVDVADAPATPEQVGAMVRDTIPRLIQRAGRDVGPVGVGVSVPGTVERRSHAVVVAPNLGWHDARLGEILTRLLGPDVGIGIGNDADLAVLAEHMRGGARDCADVVYLVGRTGVGAGIIVDGLPLRGHDGYAGEIGHNVIDPSGPACHCGKRGCLETYLGESALLTLAGDDGPHSDHRVRRVFTLARDGEPVAASAVRSVADSLGRLLGGLVNTLNPQRVILGGTFGRVFEFAPDQVIDAMRLHALDAPARSVRLSCPGLGADSALVGAAELAFAELLADPLGGRALARAATS